MNCQIRIDNVPFSFDVEGEFFVGQDEVLFDNANTIIDSRDWVNNGYKLLDLFDQETFTLLQSGIKKRLIEIMHQAGIRLPDGFNLVDYHKYVNDEQHFKIISETRFLTRQDFQLNIQNIADHISEVLECSLGLKNPLLDEEIIILRISRPQTMDINPLHRDAYLDLWQNVLNVWIPIEGCNELSSLPIAPGSHYWNESDILRTYNKGARIDGKTYHVPGIIRTDTVIDLIRPNPHLGQALIFTPYLVHGAAVNQNKDITRFSLELRLCPQP